MDKQIPHFFEVKNRSACNMSGVSKVISSSENLISIVSGNGNMEISGKHMKITAFDVETQTLCFDGEIDSLRYSAPKTPFFKRIFK